MNLKKLAIGTALIGMGLTSCQEGTNIDSSNNQNKVELAKAELAKREIEKRNAEKAKNTVNSTSAESLKVVKDSLEEQLLEIDDKLEEQVGNLNKIEKLAKEYDLEDGGAINQEIVKGVTVGLNRSGRITKFPKSIRTSIHNPENRSEESTVDVKILDYRTEREEIDNGVQSACTSCPKYRYKVIAVGQIRWPFSGDSEKLATVQLSAYAPIDGCKKKLDFDMIGQTNSAVIVQHDGDFKNGEISTFGRKSPSSNDNNYEQVDFCPDGNCGEVNKYTEQANKTRSNIEILKTERKTVTHKKQIIDASIAIKESGEPCEEAVELKLKADSLIIQIQENEAKIIELEKKNTAAVAGETANDEKNAELQKKIDEIEATNAALKAEKDKYEEKFILFGKGLKKKKEKN